MDKLKTALVVEDEEAFSVSLSWELKNAGVKVFTATDGKSGLELAKKERPDLIFLDVMLPIMSGITLLKELRKDEWGKNALVVLLTQIDNPATVAEAIECGVFKYFIKADHSVTDIVKEAIKYYSDVINGRL